MTTFAYTSGDPSHLSAAQNASMADIQGPFVDLRTFLNGNITDINLSASAAISEAKLAVGSSGLARGTFSVYRNAALSLTTGSVVVFDAEEFDVSGWHDTTTGRFTPQVAGYYRLSWNVTAVSFIAASAGWQAQLRKNSVITKAGQQCIQSGSAAAPGSTGTAIVQANGTTDFFDVIIVHGNGSTVPLSANAQTTYFQGELVGRS